MHPKNWLTPAEEDSIAKAHLRSTELFNVHLSGPIAAGDALATMVGALHERTLWIETYVTKGALDEQISDRVRFEGRHFWNALDEAKLKLRALADLGARVDVKLRALDSAIELLNVQQIVMNDAIPERYKLQLRQVAAAVKRALAA